MLQSSGQYEFTTLTVTQPFTTHMCRPSIVYGQKKKLAMQCMQPPHCTQVFTVTHVAVAVTTCDTIFLSFPMLTLIM